MEGQLRRNTGNKRITADNDGLKRLRGPTAIGREAETNSGRVTPCIADRAWPGSPALSDQGPTALIEDRSSSALSRAPALSPDLNQMLNHKRPRQSVIQPVGELAEFDARGEVLAQLLPWMCGLSGAGTAQSRRHRAAYQALASRDLATAPSVT